MKLIHKLTGLIIAGSLFVTGTAVFAAGAKINVPSSAADKLLHNVNSPVAGNQNGTVTVVEFYDYQCTDCISKYPDINNLLQKNKTVRFVSKPFPDSGSISEIAARVALVAGKHDKFPEVHRAMMQAAAKEPLTDDAVLRIAARVGVTLTEMYAPAVDKELADTRQLAKDLKIEQGKPVVFIAPTRIITATLDTAHPPLPAKTTEFVELESADITSDNLQNSVMQAKKTSEVVVLQ